MLGVRLKTWVKTHLGRERNQNHNHNQQQRSSSSYFGGGGGAPFAKPSMLATTRSPFVYRSGSHEQNMNSVTNADKSTNSSISNSASMGCPGASGLVVNGSTLLSSPDTGYSTDGLGLSNSNLLNHNHNAGGTNSPSSINTASTPLSLHQYAVSAATTATAKKREWFLQNTNTNSNSSSSVIPSIEFQFKETHTHTHTGKSGNITPKQIKPTRIQTNPWYNPKSKSKRLNSAIASSCPSTQDNQQQQHPRHSTCTTITADSGEGSFESNSQKSSPRVSFSSSSLESYKPDKGNKSRYYADKSVHPHDRDRSRDEHQSVTADAVVKNCSSSKSPYKTSWYQPPVPAAPPVQVQYDIDNSTLLSSKLSSFTPYFVNRTPATAATRKEETLSPIEQRSGLSKRGPFGFLRKLFRKGSSKKGKNSKSSSGGDGGAEVSLHDLYYHQNPIPAPGGKSKSKTSAASPYFFTELQQPPPPSVPPRISSFLTPTPNAFRRRTVSDASTSMMSMSVSMARRNVPNLAYTYREPVAVPVPVSVQHQHHHQLQQLQDGPSGVPGVTRTPVLLSRQQYHINKTEDHDHDLEYDRDDKYKIHNAYNNPASAGASQFGGGPKLSSVYCTPSRQVQPHNNGGYASYYSSPPLNSSAHPGLTAGFRSAPHTNSPICHGRIHPPTQQPFAAVNQTPKRLAPSLPPPPHSHILTRKLILQSQSPTPFTNNSSYSPIHRVAVLKGGGSGNNNGSQCQNQSQHAPRGANYNHNYTNPNPSINAFTTANDTMFGNGNNDTGARTGTGTRPEYFSPQQNHTSKYHQHHHVSASSTASQAQYKYGDSNPSHHDRQFPSTVFFSPQLHPNAAAQHDPRRRCFQYISSSNQNSPILSTHRQAGVGERVSRNGQQPHAESLQHQLRLNRLSPILRAPAAFSNHHRVYPIKNYSPMPLGGSPALSSKLVHDSYGGRSSSSGSSSSTRSPAITARKRASPSSVAAITACGGNIDKIYEEIDDDDDDRDRDRGGDDDDEDALTTAATGGEDEDGNDNDNDNDDLSTNPTVEEDLHVHKLQTSSQRTSSYSHSDEGDGLGGDYYQCDYDSSLLSTTEELDETSQEQPSTASTSTLLKSDQLREHALQPFSPYAIVDKHRPMATTTTVAPASSSSIAAAAAVASAASVDISPTTRQLLEIENDLRFCRLIAEAQTLLRELESTTTGTLARNGLETYSHHEQALQFQRRGSNTSLRAATIGRAGHGHDPQFQQQAFGSNNGSNNTYRRNQRSGSFSSSSRVEECPQSDPLRRKAYECWALRRLQQELAGCCASPLAFRHNLLPRQQFLLQQQQGKRRPQTNVNGNGLGTLL